MDMVSSETPYILSTGSGWNVAGWMLLGASVSTLILMVLIIVLVAAKFRRK